MISTHLVEILLVYSCSCSITFKMGLEAVDQNIGMAKHELMKTETMRRNSKLVPRTQKV